MRIETKQVTRFMVPYRNGSGGISRKGFCTKKKAGQFAAKEFLLDALFGEKVCRIDRAYEWEDYATRNYDLDCMKFIFDCAHCQDEGHVKHFEPDLSYCDGFSDISFCIDNGRREFCSLAWMQEVRRIGAIVARGEEPTVSDWIIQRLNDYKTMRGIEGDTK